MAKVIVYDEYTNRLFTYNLSENDPMPYAYGNTMRVREFRGSSNSPTLWTTTRAMEAWNLTRRRCPYRPYPCPAALRPVWIMPQTNTTRRALPLHAGGRGKGGISF